MCVVANVMAFIMINTSPIKVLNLYSVPNARVVSSTMSNFTAFRIAFVTFESM